MWRNIGTSDTLFGDHSILVELVQGFLISCHGTPRKRSGWTWKTQSGWVGARDKNGIRK